MKLVKFGYTSSSSYSSFTVPQNAQNLKITARGGGGGGGGASRGGQCGCIKDKNGHYKCNSCYVGGSGGDGSIANEYSIKIKYPIP